MVRSRQCFLVRGRQLSSAGSPGIQQPVSELGAVWARNKIIDGDSVSLRKNRAKVGVCCDINTMFARSSFKNRFIFGALHCVLAHMDGIVSGSAETFRHLWR
jgi:hypothetical protein